jgi:hypothetical protein
MDAAIAASKGIKQLYQSKVKCNMYYIFIMNNRLFGSIGKHNRSLRTSVISRIGPCGGQVNTKFEVATSNAIDSLVPLGSITYYL